MSALTFGLGLCIGLVVGWLARGEDARGVLGSVLGDGKPEPIVPRRHRRSQGLRPVRCRNWFRFDVGASVFAITGGAMGVYWFGFPPGYVDLWPESGFYSFLSLGVFIGGLALLFTKVRNR